MRAEAGVGGDTVLVQDAEVTEVVVAVVLVHGKGEGVEGLEPFMVGLTTLFAAAGDDADGGHGGGEGAGGGWDEAPGEEAVEAENGGRDGEGDEEEESGDEQEAL